MDWLLEKRLAEAIVHGDMKELMSVLQELYNDELVTLANAEAPEVYRTQGRFQILGKILSANDDPIALLDSANKFLGSTQVGNP